MHPALYVQEVLMLILQASLQLRSAFSSRRDLSIAWALATTSRALSEAALDVIWEDLVSMIHLCQNSLDDVFDIAPWYRDGYDMTYVRSFSMYIMLSHLFFKSSAYI